MPRSMQSEPSRTRRGPSFAKLGARPGRKHTLEEVGDVVEAVVVEGVDVEEDVIKIDEDEV
jgi:hypothetical protein